MYSVFLSSFFKKQLKKLVRRDVGLLARLEESLTRFDRTLEQSIGSGMYKIRLSGRGKGKSGGYRVYILVVEVDSVLAPVCMYSKSEEDMVDFDELTDFLQRLLSELEEM